MLRQSASASVHWKQALFVFMSFVLFFVCLFVCFWTVDTKVVLTAAILFSRYSPFTTTEWELLTKPLQWCYTHPHHPPPTPQQQPPQWRLFSMRHELKPNLVGPKQQLSLSLCVPTVSLFLPFSLSRLLFFSPLCLFRSALPLSVSLSLLLLSFCGSSLALSQWPFLSQRFKLRKVKENPLNV